MQDGVSSKGRETFTMGSVGARNAPTSRRGFVKLMGLGGALVLLPSVGAACEDADSLTAPLSGNPVTIDFARGDVALLQFAFAIEQLQADFYTQVVNGFLNSDLTITDQSVLSDLRNHEVIHRDLLQALLGSDASFTLTPTYPAVNFKSRASVLATAKMFEDLSVRAYNGIARGFSTTAAGLATLGLITRIVSVEGRHASAICDLINPKTSAFAPAAVDVATPPSNIAVELQRYLVDVLTIANAS
jgi:hypothetical protein